MTWIEGLKSIYLRDPCKTLPNSFYKTAIRADQLETSLHFKEDELIQIEIWSSDEYILHWNKSHHFKPSKILPGNFKVVILHDMYNHEIDLDGQSTPFFRLFHNLKTIDTVIDDKYIVKQLDLNTDIDQMVKILTRSYPNWEFDRSRVNSWADSPNYEPSLWRGVYSLSNNLLGFGIGEYDIDCSEVSLEWIQVDPKHSGKGIGQRVVNAVLRNSKDIANFATVSGKALTEGLQQFYKKCGFTGDDIWWVHIINNDIS